MNDNAQQSTCPVRGLTLAGQALVNKLIAFEDFRSWTQICINYHVKLQF